MSVLEYVAGLYALSFVGIGLAVWFAPEGYEDDNGFHRGPAPLKEVR